MIKTKRILALAMLLCLVFTACGQAGAPAADAPAGSSQAGSSQAGSSQTGSSAAAPEGSEAAPAGPDLSEEVHIVGYLLGEELVGMPAVMEAINAKLKEDINATLEIRYIGWGDLAAKYPLVLASGDLDFIYTANWNYYSQEAQKGAFMQLNEDMIKTYMPLHYAALDPAAYVQATIDVSGENGFFMIPTSAPDKKATALVIRKDLREKYNVAPITKASDLEPYLAAIKANEPGMIPMALDNTFDIMRPFGDLMLEKGMSGEDLYAATGVGLNIMYDWADPSGAVFTYLDEPNKAAAIESAKVIKSWYDSGYINSDVFGNTVRSKDAFAQGQSAVGYGNSIDLQTTISTAIGNGWEAEIIPIVNPDGKRPRDPYLNNGVALAAGTPNPERTLMALDLLMQDLDYMMLDYFGIEGVNYVMTEDGKVGMPEGVTNETNSYPPDVAGFWFINKDALPDQATWTDIYIQHRADLDNILGNNLFASFTMNKEPTATEEANCSNVVSQYGQPMFVGAVPDVDAAFAEYEAQLTSAGYQAIVDEAKKQLGEFAATLG